MSAPSLETEGPAGIERRTNRPSWISALRSVQPCGRGTGRTGGWAGRGGTSRGTVNHFQAASNKSKAPGHRGQQCSGSTCHILLSSLREEHQSNTRTNKADEADRFLGSLLKETTICSTLIMTMVSSRRVVAGMICVFVDAGFHLEKPSCEVRFSRQHARSEW